ncbi:hypothetical protein L249_2614 [Ophiocordyceps polyrhachis-furcata BCC 54312]|uniref:Uncharacterized protein n=1 Tax=Ophiocordyceps polyrhachis-furcata BCC 54312 TaxID=1330021 RepID=A0A367LS93_9HYPO|nr:hypothetical protein L249_2614 [Ophiocordyceps polyrhachis-furcata BCC 54312]
MHPATRPVFLRDGLRTLNSFSATSSRSDRLNAIDVEDAISFVAQHDSPIHYEALFSVLPKELLKEIWHSWGQTPHTLSNMFYASTDATSVRFVQTTIKWYREAARQKRQTCWPSLGAAQNHISVHRDVLGAINNLLYDPPTVQNDMGLRHLHLPPGELRKDTPICFDSGNNQTRWLTQNWPLWMIRHDSGQAVYASLATIRRHLDTWGGPLSRLLLGMLKEPNEYACNQRPKSYTDFLDHLEQVISRKKAFCISLGKARRRFIPDASHYWFVAGGTEVQDSQRWTFDPLVGWDDSSSVATENVSMSGQPQKHDGAYQEKNDYSNRTWFRSTLVRKPFATNRHWVDVQGSSQGGSEVAREAQRMAQAGIEVEV